MFPKCFFIICSIINLASPKSFTLVIDTTNSMQEELNVIKTDIGTVISSISNAPGLQNYVIVPFKDPDVGPPIITDSSEEFLHSIYRITANGGTDCPENSLSGIQKALEVSQEQSDIFVFTDAYANDYGKVDSINQLCATKKSKVVIFLSGFCLTDVGSLETYNKITEFCSGAILQLTPLKFRESFKYIEEVVSKDWSSVSTLTNNDITENSRFLVDAFTTEIIIVITGSWPSITIRRTTTGDVVEYEKIIYSEYYMMIRIIAEADTYEAVIRGEKCVARIYKQNKLPFQYGFSTVLAKNIKETTLRPLPDRTNYLIISIPTNVNFGAIKIEIQYFDGTPVMKITPEQVPNTPRTYYATTFINYRQTFCISVHLTTIYGNNIITGSTDTVRPQLSGMQTTWFKPIVEIIELNNNLLDYGANITIASKITGYPKPEISWQDNMGRKLNSEDILLEIPSVYISYVTLINVVANTTISCKSKNYKGEEFSVIELYVNRTATLDVIEVPKDDTFEYGTEGRLYCKVNAYPESRITWYHNFTLIDHKSNDLIEIEEDAILIRNMSLNDVGDYKCEVTNTVETKSFSAAVKISGIESPQVELENSEISVKPGDNIEVECKILQGKPTPVISWSYKSDDDYDFTTTPSGVYNNVGKLKFTSISKENKGTYRCIASNILGEDYKDLTVKVQYSPVIIGSVEETITVREGKKVQLQCEVDAIPPANVRWELTNDDIITPLDEEHYTDERNTHSFTAFSRDAGTYHCIAENELGRTEKRITVDVKVPPYIQPPEATILNLFIGDTVTLPCNVLHGNPYPVTRWEFIAPGATSTVLLRGNTTNTLVLRNVNKINEGHYICIAQNNIDTDRINIHVKVN